MPAAPIGFEPAGRGLVGQPVGGPVGRAVVEHQDRVEPALGVELVDQALGQVEVVRTGMTM